MTKKIKVIRLQMKDLKSHIDIPGIPDLYKITCIDIDMPFIYNCL